MPRIGHIDPSRAAVKHPSLRDIAWVAGIFEGEGCAARNNTNSQFVGVTQKDRWLCDRLREFFGGNVRKTVRKESWRSMSPLGAEYWHWELNGARARGFMMTVFSFMSPKRKEQIKWVLGHQTKEQYLSAIAS